MEITMQIKFGCKIILSIICNLGFLNRLLILNDQKKQLNIFLI